MESSEFSHNSSRFEAIERIGLQGGTCDTYRVKLFGKLHFLKRLKPYYAADIRYQEALRKEFETGYRLEHHGLVRYISLADDGILQRGQRLSQRQRQLPPLPLPRRLYEPLSRHYLPDHTAHQSRQAVLQFLYQSHEPRQFIHQEVQGRFGTSCLRQRQQAALKCYKF